MGPNLGEQKTEVKPYLGAILVNPTPLREARLVEITRSLVLLDNQSKTIRKPPMQAIRIRRLPNAKPSYFLMP